MDFDANRSDFTLGIVGAGIMGRGIAQVAAEAGITVLLADARAEAADEARNFCADMISRKIAKRTLSAQAGADAIARIHGTNAGPEHGYAAFRACHVVIEAAAERLDIKHSILAGVEAEVGAR